jgi:hypothetical protein
MPNNATPRLTKDAAEIPNPLLFSALPLAAWSPILAWTAQSNAKLHETFAAISCEWQDFLARRLMEDTDLLRRTGASWSPQQVWEAYASFWQKAVEDYTGEFARVTNLTGRLASSASSPAPEWEATRDVPTLDHAA